MLLLKRDRGRADAYLHVDGRDIEEPAELALKWDANTACWTLAGDAEEYRLSKERTEVVGVLGEAEEPVTPTEVADALDKSVGSVKKLLWSMSRDGQLSASDGCYSLITGNPGNLGNRDGGTGNRPVTEVTKVTGYADKTRTETEHPYEDEEVVF